MITVDTNKLKQTSPPPPPEQKEKKLHTAFLDFLFYEYVIRICKINYTLQIRL